MSGEVEEDEERRRQRKLEEALEVKSLRRIISAYLNYPEAAEEDVRRYDRSYTRLPPAHKALLSHYPLKFQKLRRCISVNSYFIFTMLQVFEPPLDMSQDVDNCEDPHLDNSQHEHCHSEGRNALSCQSASTSGRTCSWNHSQACSPERSSTINNQMEEVQEVGSEHQHEPVSISCSREGGNDKETAECCGDNVTDSDGNVIRFDSFHGGYLLSFTKKNEISDVDRMKFNVGFSSPRDWLDSSLQSNVPLVDVDKVRCIIRNIVRDWAAEGVKERQQCYKPILEELDGLFPNRSKESPPACLVPGAGLGRLALEISCLGFISQGNEFSYYMMICSSFILNHTERTGQWTIYPWIHSNCNSLSENDQLRPVSIPDIHPAGAGITEGFSMCGGDFVEVYNDSSQIGIWDAVVTCFFIDTAHNIIEYVEIISKVLKEGGVWINFGPLLYHFADMYGQEDDMSIELSLEDVKKVASHYGFQLEKEQMIETTYTTNPRSMMQNHYHAAFWTMRKKRTTSTT